MNIVNTIGRRKTSVARIYMKKGKGQIIVNKKELKEYFPSEILQYIVMEPLKITNNFANYDIKANLNGGGIKGQAEALRLAIARALVKINEEYKPLLKKEKLLTRDSRMVERKKYGHIKARKKTQYRKR